MRALLWKETRENLRWLPVGLIVIAALCWYVHPTKPANVDFSPLAQSLTSHLGIALPLLAFALGLIQCYRDLQPAARAYLHHREVTPTQLIVAKLVVGFGLYSTAVLLPIGLLSAWIAYHGLEWYPMRPAQVIPALVMALGAFLWHPAAMLMMARPASWWGTRWFPLVPAAALYFGLMISLPTGGLRTTAIGFSVTVPLLAWVLLVLCDQWKQQPDDPPPYRVNQRLQHRLLLPAFMLASSICVAVAVIVATIFFVEGWKRPTQYNSITSYETTLMAVEKSTSKPALLTVKYENVSNYVPTLIRGDYLLDQQTWVPREMTNQLDQFYESRWLHSYVFQSSYSASDGFFSSPTPAGQLVGNLRSPYTYSYDTRGCIRLYRQEPRFQWTATLSADGFHERDESFGTPFKSDPIGVGRSLFADLVNRQIPAPLIDNNGIYATDLEDRFDVLLKRKINSATLLPLAADQPVMFALRDDQSVVVYQFANLKVTSRTSEAGVAVLMIENTSPDHRHQLVEVASYKLSPEMQLHSQAHIVHTPEKRLYFYPNVNESQKLFIVSVEGDYEVRDLVIKPSANGNTINLAEEVIVALLMPCSYMGLLIWLGEPMEPSLMLRLLIGCLIGLIIALALTIFAAKRRGLSKRQTALWYLPTILLGLAVPLAILAIYKQVFRIRCDSCHRLRRIDLEQCEHCDAAAPADPALDIELHDRLSQPVLLTS